MFCRNPIKRRIRNANTHHSKRKSRSMAFIISGTHFNEWVTLGVLCSRDRITVHGFSLSLCFALRFCGWSCDTVNYPDGLLSLQRVRVHFFVVVLKLFPSNKFDETTPPVYFTQNNIVSFFFTIFISFFPFSMSLKIKHQQHA